MSVYDRELALSSRLNVFLHERFDLPADDYYARLEMGGMAELKSLLSDINNIFTLKVCLSFGTWLADRLHLSATAHDAIRESILSNPPNANGYDIEIAEPINVIAEVKCNIPINGGVIYGSAQRAGIIKDMAALMTGKNKSRVDPSTCLKFLVLLDTPEIRRATQHLVRSLKQYTEAAVFVDSEVNPDRADKLYVVHVSAA